jgi:NitT/TauT family transport system substrate-binding protein
MPIVLQESLRGLFYAPFYVALTRGAYAAEGVDVRFAPTPPPGTVVNGLFDGSIDVCWGGPMRVMETYKLRADCDLVSFAEVVTRDPFLLVGREPRPDFHLSDLSTVRLATVGEVPTPWMCARRPAPRRHQARAHQPRLWPHNGRKHRRAARRHGRCGTALRAVRLDTAG